MMHRESYQFDHAPPTPDVIVTRPGDVVTCSPHALAAAAALSAREAAGRAALKAEPLMHRLHGKPALRLVGAEREPGERASEACPPAPTAIHEPGSSRAERSVIKDAADPRWVLAVRTAESLQGAILGPEKRERLVKLGKMLGMTAFDANLVIAIVQDQARRGHAPSYCPTAGEAQLAMVPAPREGQSDAEKRARRIGIITGVIMVLVGIEMMILKWVFS